MGKASRLYTKEIRSCLDLLNMSIHEHVVLSVLKHEHHEHVVLSVLKHKHHEHYLSRTVV
jgi:hypothetical protein